MPNHWGNQPGFKIPPVLVVVVILGIISFLLFPNLFTDIYSRVNPASSLSNSENVSLPNNDNQTSINSPQYSNQILPNTDNTLSIGNGNNEIASGYWILFVNNSAIQQLPINAQDYAFILGLVNSDKNATPTNQIFLIENGQIQKYLISNEVNSVISNLATIYKRSSATSQTPTAPGTTVPDTASPNATTPNTTIPNTTVPSTTNPNTTNPNTTNPNTTNPNTMTPNNVIP
ncbi:hypothetical protein REC12_18860 [Desulfosporosinus sp. PR]|uniref:hypothetical protein n=1 Tax=Candidatus Desulfosporosinus nitrosoreducens TaxID=3401928 RepID=UPI0027EDA5C3|nr:hypothetical protein [Desulfosporosinus sp. PR]MDQ7095654.1 hypothetical protein [Desulfosporosinus sp. PR]